MAKVKETKGIERGEREAQLVMAIALINTLVEITQEINHALHAISVVDKQGIPMKKIMEIAADFLYETEPEKLLFFTYLLDVQSKNLATFAKSLEAKTKKRHFSDEIIEKVLDMNKKFNKEESGKERLMEVYTQETADSFIKLLDSITE